MDNRSHQPTSKTSPAIFALQLLCLSIAFVSVSCQGHQPHQPIRLEEMTPRGYVNDFAGIIDARSQSQMEALCRDADKNMDTQIVLVTVASLTGRSPEDFALQLGNRWGIGHKGSNRGVLVLLAPNEHKWRIEIGYGLTSILPDNLVKSIGDAMTPLLQRGDYGGASLLVIKRIIQVTQSGLSHNSGS